VTRIISADERLREQRGAKILLVGKPGVGKTTQLTTLHASSVLFVDSEAGDLSVRDFPADTIRLKTWREARDLAVRIGGPNPNFAPHMCYSQKHFETVGGWLEDLPRYKTIFADSITSISRLSFQHASQQPEAFSERTGQKDLRGAFGLHARELLQWLHQLQHAREKNVVFVAILENVVDEFGRNLGYQVQMEGSKVPREISGIIDELIVMDWIDFGDQKPTRAFVCTSPNKWNFPAKDRSGKLQQVEEPNLGKLIAKLVPNNGG